MKSSFSFSLPTPKPRQLAPSIFESKESKESKESHVDSITERTLANETIMQMQAHHEMKIKMNKNQDSFCESAIDLVAYDEIYEQTTSKRNEKKEAIQAEKQKKEV